jgi:hypothetical protein
MDAPPRLTKIRDCLGHLPLDAGGVAKAEAIHLAEPRRTAGTVQLEHCFAIGTDDVNVLRSMVIGVDHNAQTTKPENGRHPTT